MTCRQPLLIIHFFESYLHLWEKTTFLRKAASVSIYFLIWNTQQSKERLLMHGGELESMFFYARNHFMLRAHLVKRSLSRRELKRMQFIVRKRTNDKLKWMSIDLSTESERQSSINMIRIMRLTEQKRGKIKLNELSACVNLAQQRSVYPSSWEREKASLTSRVYLRSQLRRRKERLACVLRVAIESIVMTHVVNHFVAGAIYCCLISISFVSVVVGC